MSKMKATEDQVVEEIPGLQDDEVRSYSCSVFSWVFANLLLICSDLLLKQNKLYKNLMFNGKQQYV